MSGGIEHSERSVNAWMVEHLTTQRLNKTAGITTAPRQAGRAPAPRNHKEILMTEFERAWANKKGHSLLSRPTVVPEEPPALTIDKVILIFALGVYLGSLI